MENVISLLVLVVLLYANYKILQEYDRSYTLKINIVVYIILNIISNFTVGSVISGVVGAFIFTYICSWAYGGANSFIGYIGRYILAEIILSFILGVVSLLIGFLGFSAIFSGLTMLL